MLHQSQSGEMVLFPAASGPRRFKKREPAPVAIGMGPSSPSNKPRVFRAGNL